MQYRQFPFALHQPTISSPGVHVVGRHIKEAGVILREVGSKSANLNIHFLFPFRKFMLLSINYFVFLLYDTDSESTM